MKNALLILLLIFVLMPTKFVKSENGVDFIDSEGLAAVIANTVDLTKTDTHVIPKPVCNCRGAHNVPSPDGITNIPCPCGADCKCSGEQGQAFGQSADFYFTYVFGAKWCGPCNHFDKYDLPKLQSSGWKASHGKWSYGCNIVLVDVDENKELFSKYAIVGRDTTIPYYVVVHNDKKVDSHEGYLNWKDFSSYHNNQITKSRGK